jgi:hypothetical protein
VTSSATGILSATTPELARRTWPRRLLLGLFLLAVAVAALVVPPAGARLVLGAAGLAAAGRGALLARAAGAGAVGVEGRRLGLPLATAGIAALVVAALTGAGSGHVLVVAVPLALLLGSGALLGQDGGARRGGQVLGIWSVLCTALLVVAGVLRGWAGAAAVATGVGAVALAGLGVALLVGAATLRSVAGRASTSAYPAAPAGCGGCACGAGGCGGAAG